MRRIAVLILCTPVVALAVVCLFGGDANDAAHTDVDRIGAGGRIARPAIAQPLVPEHPSHDELVLLDAGQGDHAEAESIGGADGAPVDSSGPEPIRAIDLSPLSVRNIVARQASIRAFLPYLRGESDGRISVGAAARNASTLAALTILDATGRADPAMERAALLDARHDYSLSSGSRMYRFQRGDFPAFDRMKELQAEFAYNIPSVQIPFDELEALIAEALRYETL